MNNFLKYFNFYNYKILGTQNILSTNKSLLFNNSGISAIKKMIFKLKKINITSYQYCLRLKGIFNDLKINNDGTHKTSFIMLGNFLINENIFSFFNLSLKYLLFFKKMIKKKIFFSLNKIDFYNIIILLILKINVNKIIFTKKNIWKININGYLGYSLEIYYFLKNKMLEIWNIVNIQFIKKKKKIFKLKKNIIDSGLGYCRINFFKKKNLRLFDICNSIFLIVNNKNLNFTKNHNFLLNKLLKILFKIIYKKKINIFNIYTYFFKKNKIFFFKNNINNFLNFICKKEFFFLNNIKKIFIKKLNIFNLKLIFETYGILYCYTYKIIKYIYK